MVKGDESLASAPLLLHVSMFQDGTTLPEYNAHFVDIIPYLSQKASLPNSKFPEKNLQTAGFCIFFSRFL